MAKVELNYNGEDFSFNTESTSEFVLDAGLREGIDLPYSCRAGICTACKAKKIDGEVEMDGAEALDEDEIAEGYVLTCCTRITSDVAKFVFED